MYKLLLLLISIFINICFSEYSSISNNNQQQQQGLIIREGEIGSLRSNRSFVVVLINNSDQEYNDIILKCSTKCEVSDIQVSGITKNSDSLILSNLPIGKSYTFFYTYLDSVHWKLY